MIDLKRRLKRCASAVIPNVVANLDERRWLNRKTTDLLERSANCATPGEYIDALCATGAFTPIQKRSELLQLLERVQKLRPQRICEIGSAGGGTLFLLAQLSGPSAVVLSLDIRFGRARRNSFRRFATSGRRVVCIEGTSQSAVTKERVERQLAGAHLDLLFIDGDHAYDSVAADFAMYSGLVRPGGIIAFHDIVPDSWTRTGIRTTADSGGVPRFWSDLRPQLERYEELIEHPDQDGYGIGLVYWSGGLK